MTRSDPKAAPIRRRLLLVMADAEQQRALQQHLESFVPGWHLVFARGLAEAPLAVEGRPVDVILGDLAAWRAREAAPKEIQTVPFCAVVAPGNEEEAAELLDRSPAAFLLQAGDYWRLLPAVLRRAAHWQRLSGDEVARVMRHEVNNPLTGILGNAELILASEKGVSEKMRERLRTIIELAVRLRDEVSTLEKRLRGTGNSGPPLSPPVRPPVRLLDEIQR